MKRFLLLALTAGLLSPIAAKAETYWYQVMRTICIKFNKQFCFYWKSFCSWT